MLQLTQIILSGLVSGAIYSLAALGFTIVFNATSVTNFANGDFVMVGGLVSAVLVYYAHWPLPLAVVAAIVAGVLLGLALDLFGVRQARKKTILSYAMISIGFSLIIRGLMQVLAGREVLFLPSFGVLPDIRVGGVYLGSQSLWIIVALLAVSLTLSFVFLRTKLGIAMRAASQSARAAELCGIDPKFISLLAFGVAAGVGAVAGALIAPVGAAFYDYGLTYAVKGFAAAVLGGFGNPIGAVLGGLLIGLMESLTAGYVSSAFKDAVAMMVLLLCLFAWPSGLLGRVEANRV